MAKKRGELDVTVELRRLMHAAPFVPFRIKTTEGDTFTITHPDFLMISPSGATALFLSEGRGRASRPQFAADRFNGRGAQRKQEAGPTLMLKMIIFPGK